MLDARRLMVFFLLAFPAVNGLRQRIEDFDLWWHLAQGRWIVAHGAVPWQDPFSYTAAGHEWIAYSWLAEVVFFGLASRFGFAALIWLQAALATALTGLLYLACRASGARPTVAVTVSAMAALGTSFAWGLRPVLFTLVFLALLSWALRSRLPSASVPPPPPAASAAPLSPWGEGQGEGETSRLVWLAPATIVLWVNVHVLFVWGIGLLGFAALCRTREKGWSAARGLWLATGLAVVASLANPYGPWIFAEVWRMASQPLLAPEVTEFQSPDFRGPVGLAMAAFFLPAVVVLGLSRDRPTPFELGTFFGALVFGLMIQRNMALFAILAAPTIARMLEGLLPAPSGPARAPGPALQIVHAALLAGGFAYVGSQAPAVSADWRDHVSPRRFPIAAVDHLERNPPRRIFNDFDWGGFLIYRLHPGVRVSIDGRTQVYGREILRPYMRTHFLRPGWEEYLESCDPDVVLWPAGEPLANLLRELPAWRVELEDETAIVLRRVAP